MYALVDCSGWLKESQDSFEKLLHLCQLNRHVLVAQKQAARVWNLLRTAKVAPHTSAEHCT